MRNLKKALKKLNAEYDGTFDFTIQKEDDKIFVFDKNEEYNVGYAEYLYVLAVQFADEMGYEYPEDIEDKIFEKLNDAVRADFGEEAYIDWDTSERLIVEK